MRGKSEQEQFHTSSGDLKGIIIDHTNKYTVVENWLFERGDLSAGDKLIYVVLKSWANCERIWPSHKTIARKSSVSVATVKRSLNNLRGKKLLIVESGKGSGGCNIYHLCGPEGIPKGVAHRELPSLAQPERPGSSQRATTNTSLQIQDTTTTAVVVVDDIKKLINGTPFQGIDEQALMKLSKKYGFKLVFDSLDMLIQTYRQSGKFVNDSTAVLASGLSKGVIPPSGYVPYHQRIENERKTKETADLRQAADAKKKEAEEEAFNAKVAQFDALPLHDQDKWLKRARTELSPSLKGFKKAVRIMAIELCSKGLRDRQGKNGSVG